MLICPLLKKGSFDATTFFFFFLIEREREYESLIGKLLLICASWLPFIFPVVNCVILALKSHVDQT